MNTRKVAFVVAGLAMVGALMAGCSSSVSSDPELGSVVLADTACAVPDADGRTAIAPTDTCAEVQAGSLSVLFSLARDDIKDARIKVVSGDSQIVVPLEAPESDGGFLMGFFAEKEGTAEIAVIVTLADGSGEQEIQKLLVTAVPGTGGVVPVPPMSNPESDSDAGSGAEWTDSSAIPSNGG